LLEKNKTFPSPLEESEVLKVWASTNRYDDTWSEPDFTYSVKSPSYQDVPASLIPDFYKDFVLKQQKALGVPRSAIMVPVLTIASAILGAAFKIKPSQNSKYEEALNLWGLIIAPPGSRKTSVLDILRPALKMISGFFTKKRKETEA